MRAATVLREGAAKEVEAEVTWGAGETYQSAAEAAKTNRTFGRGGTYNGKNFNQHNLKRGEVAGGAMVTSGAGVDGGAGEASTEYRPALILLARLLQLQPAWRLCGRRCESNQVTSLVSVLIDSLWRWKPDIIEFRFRSQL